MTTTRTTLVLNDNVQIIEINKDKINFEATFKVICENDKTFDAVVVSRAKLQTGEPLNYVTAENGWLSGDVYWACVVGY